MGSTSTNTVSGDLKLILDDSAACGISLEIIDLPVISRQHVDIRYGRHL